MFLSTMHHCWQENLILVLKYENLCFRCFLSSCECPYLFNKCFSKYYNFSFINRKFCTMILSNRYLRVTTFTPEQPDESTTTKKSFWHKRMKRVILSLLLYQLKQIFISQSWQKWSLIFSACQKRVVKEYKNFTRTNKFLLLKTKIIHEKG